MGIRTCRLVLLVAVVVTSATARAEDILRTAETLWYDAKDESRVGFRVELSGLTAAKAAEVVAKTLGGRAVTSGASWTIEGTPLGKIVLEGATSRTIFLSTERVPMTAVGRLQTALADLKAAGAGDRDGTRRLLTEVTHDEPKAAGTGYLRDLQQNFGSADHLRQMRESGDVPTTGPLLIVDGKATRHQFHNTWDPLAQAKKVLGMSAVTIKHGVVDHDKYLSAVSGVDAITLGKLREAHAKHLADGKPYVFRYFLGDPNGPHDGYTNRALRQRPDAVIGVLPNDTIGKQPVVLRPGSVVYHNRTYHSANIVGEHNPGLLNANIIQALTMNKYVEAKFWKDYAPGAMAETTLLADFKPTARDVAALVRQLNERFPEGWIIKGVDDTNTGRAGLVTNESDLPQLLKDYGTGGFAQHLAAQRAAHKGLDDDALVSALRTHPDFLAWRLVEFLAHPERAIVQRRLNIAREFKVEIQGGRVIGEGESHARFDTRTARVPASLGNLGEARAGAEAFAKEIVGKLPPELRGTPFGMDIVQLMDGKFALIESNPGPGSGLLVGTPDSIEAHQKFLLAYPSLVREGAVHAAGMGEREQMRFLAEKFRRWGIDPRVHFPTFRFLPDHIDTALQRVDVPIENGLPGCTGVRLL